MLFFLKSNVLFLHNLKDSVSLHHRSFLIYKFHWKCNICYIGHATQRLENRIKLLVFPAIRSNSLTHSTDSCHQNASSISQHLSANEPYANTFNLNMFTILEVSNNELQLSVLEGFYITQYLPTLCKQKDFYNFLLFNLTDYTSTQPDVVEEKTKINCTNPSW